MTCGEALLRHGPEGYRRYGPDAYHRPFGPDPYWFPRSRAGLWPVGPSYGMPTWTRTQFRVRMCDRADISELRKLDQLQSCSEEFRFNALYPRHRIRSPVGED